MHISNEELKYLKKIVDNSADKIESSGTFLSLFSGGWKNDPVPALQLAIAILLDKPISIIVVDGTKVPEHLKKIAFAIEYFTDPSQLPEAVTRISKKIKNEIKN